MSYLTLQQGIPDFSKAVFSLWFRAPRESVIKASNQFLPTDAEGFFKMQRVLPLVTFGRKQENKNYQPIIANIVSGSPPANPVEIYEAVAYEPMQAYEVDPCYIGLVCLEDGTFFLDFNIQMDIYGSYESMAWLRTSLAYNPGGDPSPGTGQVGDYMSTIEDATYVVQDAQPERFHVTSNNTFEPDKWHHLLLSFDIDGISKLGSDYPTSSCSLWYAIDDVDYRGQENLQPYRDEGDGLDDNIIVTYNAYNFSGFDPTSNLQSNHYVALPSGGIESGQVPSDGAELALPAASGQVDAICRVEMAEFQMFTGITLDTNFENNRRVFIDADGKPVDPNAGATKEDPRGPAEKLLGKPPDILLHGSSNWKSGRNTGSLGTEIGTGGSITLLPEGQFIPVAGIEQFKPDPALGA